MELSKFHGIPWNFPFDLEKFHGIPWNFWRVPWNSMELWNIDINKFHNWGSVFHCFSYDFMSLYIRQSISSWNIDIFQFQSNFLVPLILVKWRYSILNGGLFDIHSVSDRTYEFITATIYNIIIFSFPLYGTHGAVLYSRIFCIKYFKHQDDWRLVGHLGVPVGVYTKMWLWCLSRHFNSTLISCIFKQEIYTQGRIHLFDVITAYPLRRKYIWKSYIC